MRTIILWSGKGVYPGWQYVVQYGMLEWTALSE